MTAGASAMTNKGWYPDPAGQGWRYWDGARWAAPPRKPRRRWPWVIAAGVPAAILVLCGLLWLGIRPLGGASLSDLRETADRVQLPPDYKVVDEDSYGNEFCLDECV